MKNICRSVETIPFSTVIIQGSLSVEVTKGSQLSIKIWADYAEDIDKITFKQEERKLIIGQTFNGGTLTIINGIRYNSGFKGDIQICVTSPDVKMGMVQGSGRLYLSNLSQTDLDLIVQGSGDAGCCGDVKNLTLTVQGSGNINTTSVIANSANVMVQGSGDVLVRATDKIDASVFGSGDIKVFGNPTNRKTEIIGSGDIDFN